MSNSGNTVSDEAARMQVRYVTDPVPRILVVEDCLGIRQTLAEVLTRSGYHVDEAEDAAAGWDALQSHRYDLVISDNNMPRVSGGELVRRMRIAGITVPVIMTSERVSAENLTMKLAALLLKPFTGDELLQTVKKILHPGNSVNRKTELAAVSQVHQMLVDPWSVAR